MRRPSDPRVLPWRAFVALRLSPPIAAGAIAASLAGLVLPSTYEREALDWAAQGAGQDAVNLAVYPAMLLLARSALRGSLRAYIAWLGTTAYSAYSYLLYAGFVHFSGWFLVYVATFGLSVFALALGLSALDARALRATFRTAAWMPSTGTLLTVLGVLFAGLWLSEIVPALLAGSVPEAVRAAGLVTNPVWVLDLGVVLPAMVASGVLLRRDQRPEAVLLAGPLLSFGAVMGVAIIGMLAMLAARGGSFEIVPTVAISATVLAEAAALRRLLIDVPADATIEQATRDGTRRPPVSPSDAAPPREHVAAR